MSRPPCPPSASPPRCWRCACLPGTRTGVDYLEGVKAELQERVDNGIAAANPERFRVMWSAFTPFWDTSLQAFIQQKYGAVSVSEVLSGWRGEAKWLIDPDDPLACLAYRTQLAPGNCQFAPSIDWAEQVVEPGPQVQGGRGDLQQQLGLQAGGGPRPDGPGRAAASMQRCADASRSTWTCSTPPSPAGPRSKPRWTASSR